jgi:alpha-1,2-glucosyltransferase
MTMTYALDCRLIITKLWKRESPSSISSWLKDYKPISSDALHTAFNIALFPPLFFFSGLFYTDVLSTCLVLRSYRLFLQRNGAYKNSAEGLVWVYIAGIISLTMRQTNIFWVAVFMAGLEAVRTLKSNESGKLGQQYTFDKKTVSSEFKRYSHGYIHDVPLKDAGVHGKFFTITLIST